jgi:hypothetical protein
VTDKEARAREIEWNEKITNAVTEQTWNTALRKMAGTACLITIISIPLIIFTALTVSPMAGCVTACAIFVALSAATGILSKVMNHRNAVLDASKLMTSSMTDIKPPS